MVFMTGEISKRDKNPIYIDDNKIEGCIIRFQIKPPCPEVSF